MGSKESGKGKRVPFEKKRLPGIFRKVLLSLVIVTAFLALTEGALQILRPYSLISYCDYISPNLYVNDEILGCRTAAGQRGLYERAEIRNEVILNNYGAHDTCVGPKKAGEFRILVMGGSFSANLEVPVEETWPKLFEKKIQKRNKKIKVVNCANPAVNIDYFLSCFKHYRLLEKIQPDLILSAFSFHRLDDITHPVLKFHQYEGCVLLYRSPESLLVGERLIKQRSQNILFLLFKSSPLLRRCFLFKLAFQVDSKRLKTPIRGNVCYLPALEPQRVSTRKVLEELDETVRAFGCPLVFYYIPQAGACNSRDILIHREKMESLFKGIERRRKVISSRLLEKFEKEGRESVYFPLDEHPNAGGIRCIAGEIFDDVLESGFVPLQ